ncbi:MAG: ABC transporter permease [Acetobacteraceae bacterium]
MSESSAIGRALTEAVVALRREHSPVPIMAVTVLVFVLFAALAPGRFPTAANMNSIGFQVPETALLGMGVMLSMVLGGIDLSVVAIADLSSVTMVQYFAFAGATHPGGRGLLIVAIGVVIALAVGAVCGALNGLIIGRLRVTAILATLATMEMFGGLAIAWTGGNTLPDVPAAILDIGNLSPGGVPLPAIIFLGCALLVALLLNGSRFGIRAILVGANPRAASLSGIREPRVQLGIYTASGLLSAVAGIIFVGRTAGATPNYGAASYVLLAVVIAVLAGVDPLGGFGTVVGVALAAFVLEMIRSGFVALNLNQFLYEAAQGAILIVVLAAGSIAQGNVRWFARLKRPLTHR